VGSKYTRVNKKVTVILVFLKTAEKMVNIDIENITSFALTWSPLSLQY